MPRLPAPCAPPLGRAAPFLLLALVACSSTPTRPSAHAPEAERLLRYAEDALAEGRLARAEDALRAARHTDPPAPPADLALVEAAIHIERERFDAARDVLGTVPQSLAARELEGRIQLREGGFDTAARTFEELAAAAPDAAAARRLTDLAAVAAGFSFYAEGRYVDAIDTWSTIEDDATYESLSQALASANAAAGADVAGGAR